MGQDGKDLSTELVMIGDLGAPFGVKGWLNVNSYTEPQANIWDFKAWFLHNGSDNLMLRSDEPNVQSSYHPIARVKELRARFLVLLEGVVDRSAAAVLTNKKIFVKRADFPGLSEDQYYWIDLVGSQVYNLVKEPMGILDYVFHNGANDVMVIKHDSKEYLIPYRLGEFVVDINVREKKIIVNWDLN